ncbi:MAG: sugar phosphate isomerase/epimerase family protein [Planctomycetota bacterium]|nr:sugar phosphate isomerase/epimerase family protein [Planctomycetota bacterium]
MSDRRSFLQAAFGMFAAKRTIGAEPDPTAEENTVSNAPRFRISLAQWSLHRTIRSGELDAMDFAACSTGTFGISGLEYVNSFYRERRDDPTLPDELKQRATDHGASSLLIMIDGEGRLGAPEQDERSDAVDRHHRWMRIAKAIGCHSIRVNANSEGTPDEQIARCALGMEQLLEHADELELNVLIENHGGHSSNGAWLSNLMRTVDHPRFGTLPDFGNFVLDWDTMETYDRYKGVTELMPFAKAVSAKSNDFDEDGNETSTDYERMLKIVLDTGYRGWIGVEYEGGGLSEADGIVRTRELLMKHGGRP